MNRLWRGFFLLFLLFLGSTPGCHTLKLTGLTSDKLEKIDKEARIHRPSKDAFRVSQFIFFSDVEIKRNAPLFQELAQLREQVYKELRLVSTGNPINIYLFSDRDRYDRYIHSSYPDLPDRRAFFVAQPHSVGSGEDLYVFTYWSDRLRQDLRHELTHALLHSCLKDVPLWLDEGLAEYFELPPEVKGLNRAHVRALNQPDLQPDLSRLEQLGQVIQMRPAEYREAWLWVYWMLHSNSEVKQLLLEYLQQLRTDPNPGPMQPRLAAVVPSLERAFREQLARLDTDRRVSELRRFPSGKIREVK
jgi:hypothetical protein